MAVLYITEFAKQGRDQAGYINQNATPEEPPIVTSTVAIGAGSVQSAVFNAATALIRVHTDAVCSIEVGANPTASATSRRMAANTTEQIAVKPGTSLRLAVIINT